jgi:demethylmenaquinone methyltransferase/2-methoxy-6-polyprenyl-1,4-benzoquinol methylase
MSRILSLSRKRGHLSARRGLPCPARTPGFLDSRIIFDDTVDENNPRVAVSSLVLMRILESAPERYDGGMRLLTLGGWERSLDALAEAAVPVPGLRLLELGCGTGALTERLIARGGQVVAIDQSPEMLDRARQRLAGAPADRLGLEERTAAEVDGFEPETFDAVAASYVLSEMSPGERLYVLRAAARALRPGGRLALVDEALPRRAWQRWLHRGVRLPRALLTWLVTGSTTRAIPDLAAEVREAGLSVQVERRARLGTVALVVAERLR